MRYLKLLFFLIPLLSSAQPYLPHFIDSANHTSEVRADTLILYQNVYSFPMDKDFEWVLDSIQIDKSGGTIVAELYYVGPPINGTSVGRPPAFSKTVTKDTLRIDQLSLGQYKLIVHTFEPNEDSTFNAVTGTYIKLDSTLSDSDTSCFEILSDKSFSLEKGIEIFPNPTADFLYFKNLKNATLKVEITDASGAVVKQGVVSEGRPRLDVANLAKGIYSVGLVADGVLKETKMLLIQ